MPEAIAAPPPQASKPSTAPPPAKPPAVPAPDQAPKPETKTEESFYDAIDKIEADSKKPVPAAKKEGKESPPSKDAKADTAKPVDVPPAKDESSGKDDGSASDAGKPPEKPFKAAELRNAYESLKARNKKLEAEHEALKAEHEKAKTAKPPEDPEKPKLVEALTEKDKRIKELEETLKFKAYEETDDFKKSYQQPYVDAFKAGRDAAAELTVTDSDGTERPGRPQDFDRVMAATNTKEASALARSLFGDDAQAIIAHRIEVSRLYQAGQRAIEEYRTKGAEREKTRVAEEARQQEEQKKQHAEISGTYRTHVEEAVKKYPEWFAPQEGDTADAESNELLKKGMSIADIGFSPPSNMAPQTLAKIHSVIRNKAGAFDRVVHDYRKKVTTLEARVTELETQLKEYEESVPGKDAGRGGQTTKPVSVDEEIDALDRAMSR